MRTTFLLLLFAFSQLSAATPSGKIIVEWVTSLKKQQSFDVHREYAGAVVRGDDIVVALRSGEMVVLNKGGRIHLRRQYEGSHTIKPLVDAQNSTLYLATGLALRALDKYYDEKWYLSFRAPIATEPLVDGNILYIATLDNSIYAIDKESGVILGSYTSYDPVPLSYIRLAKPVKIDDKIVFGFANGNIVFFKIKQDGKESVDIMPYFRFRTKKSTITSGHRFYDLFSLQGTTENLLFSNGELGGKIVAGKTVPVTHMANIILTKAADAHSYIGYGESGVYQFSIAGNFERYLFQTKNFVSGLITEKEGVLITTEGEPTFLARREGSVYFVNREYSQLYDTLLISGGVSSQPVQCDDGILVLTNGGAVTKIILKENR
ncbi:PQQ-binding-like beta-propeller repeat protein [bacterium]|nr:PQQ-binding-like beta-propeller repeat protein [bacterium]